MKLTHTTTPLIISVGESLRIDGQYEYYPHENKTSVIINNLYHEIKWPQFYWQMASVIAYDNNGKEISERLAMIGETRDLRLKYFPSDQQISTAQVKKNFKADVIQLRTVEIAKQSTVLMAS